MILWYQNFWYQKLISYKKVHQFQVSYKKNRTNFLISENDFSRIKKDFKISENDFKKMVFGYLKLFSDIKKKQFLLSENHFLISENRTNYW